MSQKRVKAERRKQAQDKNWDALEQLLPELAQWARLNTRQAMKGKPEDALELVKAVYAHGDSVAAETKQKLPPDKPLACRRGCSYCCQVRADASPAEVLYLAAFIRTTFTPEQFEETLQRISALMAQPERLTEHGRVAGHVPCPLLIEGECSAYQARPIVCRGWTSLSVDGCEYSANHPGCQDRVLLYFPGSQVWKSLLAGVVEGTQDCGKQYEPQELVTALHVALTHDDATQRWFAGDSVFGQ